MFAIVHAGCRQIVVSCIREHCASEEALYKDPQVYPTSVHVVLGASVREARERVSGKQQTGSMQDAAYEFRRIPLLRTRVNREHGGASTRVWRKLSPMEVEAPTLEVPPAKLMREPLFWAAAAFVGVVGLAGTFSMAAWMVFVPGPLADMLVVLSVLGVPVLLGRRSRALRAGTVLLLVWLPVVLAVLLVPMLFPKHTLFSVSNVVFWPP